MQLLVSVTDAAEAAMALAGGADIIDAKDPSTGTLGAVSLAAFREIRQAAGSRTVSAALGEAADETSIERDAEAFTAAGARFVKIGFAGISSEARIASLVSAAVHGAVHGAVRGAQRPRPGQHGVVAVAYADADPHLDLAPTALIAVAARAGATGILLDTSDKAGPGLRGHMGPEALAAWVAAVHEAGLLAALAGKLMAADLTFVRDLGTDIAGVRGAACEGGRLGRVAIERVRELQALSQKSSAV